MMNPLERQGFSQTSLENGWCRLDVDGRIVGPVELHANVTGVCEVLGNMIKLVTGQR